MKTVKCAVCGQEVPEHDAESTTIGKKREYRCFKCIDDGRSQAVARRFLYFSYTAEGKGREAIGKKKK